MFYYHIHNIPGTSPNAGHNCYNLAGLSVNIYIASKQYNIALRRAVF